MLTEADTCREYVRPHLRAAGWDDDPRSFVEQRTFTDGRIIPVGTRVRRGPVNRADYLLRYTRDFTLAVLEAKREYKQPGDGLGQAKEYAEICWQLWSSRWNRTGEHRRPRIIYLADRTILVDDPKDKTFAPFGDARARPGPRRW